MSRTVIHTAGTVQTELLMVTPYFVPTEGETWVLKDLRRRDVRVRIVTNSLESATDVAAQSGYRRYRVALLEEGVELYEIRSRLGSIRGSGQTAAVSRYGNYSLHAKLFVFDRKKLFIGSMNFDQRSKHLNTEIGLIIDSPELAQQMATRFDAMAQPENAYAPVLVAASPWRSPLVWHTEEMAKLLTTPGSLQGAHGKGESSISSPCYRLPVNYERAQSEGIDLYLGPRSLPGRARRTAADCTGRDQRPACVCRTLRLRVFIALTT